MHFLGGYGLTQKPIDLARASASSSRTMDMDRSALPDERAGRFGIQAMGERVVILSPREKLLLRRIANGKSDNLISQEIGGTQEQIGMQRKRLIEKLQIQSHAQLVALAGQLAAWPARRQRQIKEKGTAVRTDPAAVNPISRSRNT